MGLAIVLLFVAVALVSGDGGGASVKPKGTPPKARKLDELTRLADLPEDWRQFFRVVAMGESGFNNLRGLGDPLLFPPWASPNTKVSKSTQDAEALAARRAYKRAMEQGRYSACGNPWPASRYVFGSGGWFGGLPSNMLHAFTGTPLACADPWLVFEPEASLVMAIAMAKRLVGNPAFASRPFFKTIRAGWASVEVMNDDAFLAKKIGKWREAAQDAGVAPSLLDAKPSHLPKIDAVKLYQYLKEHAGKGEPNDVELFERGALLVGVHPSGRWAIFGGDVDRGVASAWLQGTAKSAPPQLIAMGIGGKPAAEDWIAQTQGGIV